MYQDFYEKIEKGILEQSNLGKEQFVEEKMITIYQHPKFEGKHFAIMTSKEFKYFKLKGEKRFDKNHTSSQRTLIGRVKSCYHKGNTHFFTAIITILINKFIDEYHNKLVSTHTIDNLQYEVVSDYMTELINDLSKNSVYDKYSELFNMDIKYLLSVDKNTFIKYIVDKICLFFDEYKIVIAKNEQPSEFFNDENIDIEYTNEMFLEDIMYGVLNKYKLYSYEFIEKKAITTYEVEEFQGCRHSFMKKNEFEDFKKNKRTYFKETKSFSYKEKLIRKMICTYNRLHKEDSELLLKHYINLLTKMFMTEFHKYLVENNLLDSLDKKWLKEYLKYTDFKSTQKYYSFINIDAKYMLSLNKTDFTNYIIDKICEFYDDYRLVVVKNIKEEREKDLEEVKYNIECFIKKYSLTKEDLNSYLTQIGVELYERQT